MHELAIAEALLDAVRREMQPYPGARVRAVSVRVGALRQVQPACLELCFHAAAADTCADGAALLIEPVPARAHCSVCQAEFPVAEEWFECPRCQATSGDLLAGGEILLTGVEIEAAAVSAGRC